jgi:hypothetical protein
MRIDPVYPVNPVEKQAAAQRLQFWHSRKLA